MSEHWEWGGGARTEENFRAAGFVRVPEGTDYRLIVAGIPVKRDPGGHVWAPAWAVAAAAHADPAMLLRARDGTEDLRRALAAEHGLAQETR